MNQPLPTLIATMRQALSTTVQPELTSDHARSQLAGVLDVLAKVERLLAWSPDVLIEQLDIAQAALERFAARTGREAPRAVPARPLKQAELEQLLREAGALIASHADWLLDPSTPLLPAERQELDAGLRDAMRGQLLAERRFIPRADFGAMTAGAQAATP